MGSRRAFMYEGPGYNSWREMPNMARARGGNICGSVRHSNGVAKDIVVAGGLYEEPRNTVEIFSVQTETWRQGKAKEK